ncbi:hypothetical protein CspHIS471_0601760 [Cutaneotrichosporon sp. HIS471]|nr:hypothetical protein CspHIS471_0601760 [Cutaneotrichosporon sp. HIS471]
MGRAALSGTYIYLLTKGMSRGEVQSTLKLIRNNGGTTVGDPMVDCLTHVVVRVPKGIPRRKNLECPVWPMRLPERVNDWDFDSLVSTFTLGDGPARLDRRGQMRFVAVVQEQWLRDSLDKGRALGDGDTYGGWLVRGVPLEPHAQAPVVERDPRKRRQSALAAASSSSSSSSISPIDPPGHPAIDLRDIRPSWAEYNGNHSVRCRESPCANNGWPKRESDRGIRSTSSSAAGDASEGRPITLRQRLNSEWFGNTKAPEEQPHIDRPPQPEDPQPVLHTPQSLSLADLFPSGPASLSVAERDAAYAANLLRGLDDSGVDPMERLEGIGDRQVQSPVYPNGSTPAPAPAGSEANAQAATTSVPDESPSPSTKRKTVTAIPTVKTEVIDSPPAQHLPLTPNSTITQSSQLAQPPEPMWRSGPSLVPGKVPLAPPALDNNGQLGQSSQSKAPVEQASARPWSSASSSESLSGAPPPPTSPPACPPRRPPVPQVTIHAQPPVAATSTQPHMPSSVVGPAPPLPATPAAITRPSTSAAPQAPPSVPAPAPNLPAPNPTVPTPTANASDSLPKSNNPTGVLAQHQPMPLDFYVDDREGQGRGIQALITGQGGGVLVPASQARFVILQLDKGHPPANQRERDLVAKKGVHPCALVLSRTWVVDCVVFQAQLLDPMPYLVPSGSPSAAGRTRSLSAASIDTPLSRKRARILPASEPDPEPELEQDVENLESEYKDSDEEAELGDISERESRNVALLISRLKEWNGEGGKMVFIQHCSHEQQMQRRPTLSHTRAFVPRTSVGGAQPVHLPLTPTVTGFATYPPSPPDRPLSPMFGPLKNKFFYVQHAGVDETERVRIETYIKAMEGTVMPNLKGWHVLPAFILVFPQRDKIIRRFRVKEPDNVHLKEEHELTPSHRRHRVEMLDSILDVEKDPSPQYLRLRNSPPPETLDCEAIVSLYGLINDTPHERAPEGPPYDAEPRRWVKGTGNCSWRVFDIQWFYDYEKQTAWEAVHNFRDHYEITGRWVPPRTGEATSAGMATSPPPDGPLTPPLLNTILPATPQVEELSSPTLSVLGMPSKSAVPLSSPTEPSPTEPSPTESPPTETAFAVVAPPPTPPPQCLLFPHLASAPSVTAQDDRDPEVRDPPPPSSPSYPPQLEATGRIQTPEFTRSPAFGPLDLAGLESPNPDIALDPPNPVATPNDDDDDGLWSIDDVQIPPEVVDSTSPIPASPTAKQATVAPLSDDLCLTIENMAAAESDENAPADINPVVKLPSAPFREVLTLSDGSSNIIEVEEEMRSAESDGMVTDETDEMVAAERDETPATRNDEMVVEESDEMVATKSDEVMDIDPFVEPLPASDVPPPSSTVAENLTIPDAALETPDPVVPLTSTASPSGSSLRPSPPSPRQAQHSPHAMTAVTPPISPTKQIFAPSGAPLRLVLVGCSVAFRRALEANGAYITTFQENPHFAVLHLNPGETVDTSPDLLTQQGEFLSPFHVNVVTSQWVFDCIATDDLRDWRRHEVMVPVPALALPTPIESGPSSPIKGSPSSSPLQPPPFVAAEPPPVSLKKSTKVSTSTKGKRKRSPARASSSAASARKVKRLSDVGGGGDGSGGAGPGQSTLFLQRRAVHKPFDYRDVDSDPPEKGSGDGDIVDNERDLAHGRDPLDNGRSSPLTPPPYAKNDSLPPIPTATVKDHEGEPVEPVGPVEPGGAQEIPEPTWQKPSHRAATLAMVAALNGMPSQSEVTERDFMKRKFGVCVGYRRRIFGDGGPNRHVGPAVGVPETEVEEPLWTSAGHKEAVEALIAAVCAFPEPIKTSLYKWLSNATFGPTAVKGVSFYRQYKYYLKQRVPSIEAMFAYDRSSNVSGLSAQPLHFDAPVTNEDSEDEGDNIDDHHLDDEPVPEPSDVPYSDFSLRKFGAGDDALSANTILKHYGWFVNRQCFGWRKRMFGNGLPPVATGPAMTVPSTNVAEPKWKGTNHKEAVEELIATVAAFPGPIPETLTGWLTKTAFGSTSLKGSTLYGPYKAYIKQRVPNLEAMFLYSSNRRG